MSMKQSQNSSNYPKETKKESCESVISNSNSKETSIINNNSDYDVMLTSSHINPKNDQSYMNHNNDNNNDSNSNIASFPLLKNLIIDNSSNANLNIDNHLIEPQINSLRVVNTNKSQYDKLDLQQLTYTLMKDYSQLKISKEEEFMNRMEFDIYKRHMQTKHIDQLIEENKAKITEEEKRKAFNRLIEDTNRRLAVKENLNQMKEKINKDIFQSPSKTYRISEWNEIYEERFKKYNDEYNKRLEQRQNEERLKREMKEMEEVNMAKAKVKSKRKSKKESLDGIQRTVDHLYDDSKLRRLKKANEDYYSNKMPKSKQKTNISLKSRNNNANNNNSSASRNNMPNCNTTNNQNNSSSYIIGHNNYSKPNLTEKTKGASKQFSIESLVKENCCEINISNKTNTKDGKCKGKALSCHKDKRQYSHSSRVKTRNKSHNTHTLQKKFNQLEAHPRELEFGLPLRQSGDLKDCIHDKVFKISLSPPRENITKEKQILHTVKSISKVKSESVSRNKNKNKENHIKKSNPLLIYSTTNKDNNNKIVDYFFTQRLKHLKEYFN